jgi:hypothetical protein
MSLGFRLLAPIFLAAWIAAAAFLLSHAASAPSNRHTFVSRSAVCPEKR